MHMDRVVCASCFPTVILSLAVHIAGGMSALPPPLTSVPGVADSISSSILDATRVWTGWWCGPLLGALYSGSEKLRAYVCIHGLPVVLAQEPSVALSLIHLVLRDTGEGHILEHT